MINKKTGRPQGTTGKARAISDKELNAVIAVSKDYRHAERNIAMLIMSNYLGLRAKEMALLKVLDVFDGENLRLTLRLVAKYTKGGYHRDVSLENKRVIASMRDYINYRIESDGLAFNVQSPLFRSQQGSAFSANAVSRLFINIYERAGIDNASSHTGRRSLITRLSESNIDIFSIAQIAGHQSIQTTQAYITSNPARLRNILMGI